MIFYFINLYINLNYLYYYNYNILFIYMKKIFFIIKIINYCFSSSSSSSSSSKKDFIKSNVFI